MKWTNERSDHIEDRRGGKKKAVGGGLIALVIGLIIYFINGDPSAIVNFTEGNGLSQPEPQEQVLSKEEEQERELVSMIMAWNEQTWQNIFEENNMEYTPVSVVMFTGQTRSACGIAQEEMGPFYCPADQKIYVDLHFFRDLQNRFGAKVTAFTVAYVLAHENGHHVQDLLGVLSQQDKLRKSNRYSKKQLNKVSVAVELQADFLAGVWAKRNNERSGGNILESGDIAAAVDAAQAVGDDHIQEMAQGYVNQDSFTHGSSKQRVEWFLKGYKTGDINRGDTFKALLGTEI